MAYKALDIAKKLIKLADYDTANGGDNLTNLRLQKLLYYEQGYHLAQFGTTLFDEEIEAWMYGLVVPSVYEYYHPNGSKPLPVPEDNELITMTDDEEVMFAQVFEAYRDFSAIGLMNKTHHESPWAALNRRGHGVVISKESMQKFFITQLY